MTEDQGVAFGPGAREPNPQAGSVLRASPPNADSYRGWRISYDPPPIPVRCFDWTATHPDFDASWEGEEDGWVGNGLSVSAGSRESLIAEIDAYLEENPE